MYFFVCNAGIYTPYGILRRIICVLFPTPQKNSTQNLNITFINNSIP